jgi:hypothetical protein
MSDLSFIEKTKLEKLLGMEGGYVLDFSNRTFAEFILDSTGKNIYDGNYEYASGSKANRLRSFWSKEPNHLVGKLIADLLEYSQQCSSSSGDNRLCEECYRIAQRLQQGAPVQEIEAISPISGGRDFEVLAKSVKDAIGRNEPESGLDRLHTFLVKYIRVLCEKRGISADRNKPLHSMFGEYVRCMKRQGLIESEMTERILKSCISTMEAFNRVRNDQSFAHDNPLLNYSESLLIFNHVVSVVRFIAAIETPADEAKRLEIAAAEDNDDIPF